MVVNLRENQYIEELGRKIAGLNQEMKSNLEKIQNPPAKALVETSREVMVGVQKAFDHYLEKSEDAWRV